MGCGFKRLRMSAYCQVSPRSERRYESASARDPVDWRKAGRPMPVLPAPASTPSRLGTSNLLPTRSTAQTFLSGIPDKSHCAAASTASPRCRCKWTGPKPCDTPQISRNSSRGIATSAIWNVTYFAYCVTLAPFSGVVGSLPSLAFEMQPGRILHCGGPPECRTTPQNLFFRM